MANNWTREQSIVVFNLYCKIPFKKSSKTHPDVIEIANLIGRTPSAVNMKIGNFGSFDPELQRQGISGLTNASRLDKAIWDEFNADWEKLAYESELLIAQFKNKDVETIIGEAPLHIPQGYTREQVTKVRVNQSFFRSAVLSAYNNTCCITGLALPQLLIASHIKPWRVSDAQTERTNPQNGLCLNSLHDRAFDKGLITITGDYSIVLSKEIKEHCTQEVFSDYFLRYENKKIITPSRFLPSESAIIYHNEHVFVG